MQHTLQDLQNLIHHLRDPECGCPWDIEQNFESIKPHMIEEAYEVAHAIERENLDELKDELGDLLFQIMFLSHLASEKGHFDVNDVISHVTEKMIFRHPHVFGDSEANSAKEVESRIWEEHKAKERKTSKHQNNYYLDSVTRNLPSLLLANKLQKRVKRVGFEYQNIESVFSKMQEEVTELREACTQADQDKIAEEYGDLLLVTALLGTELNLNSEESLRHACFKFIERFNKVEKNISEQNKTLQEATITEMLHAWSQIKQDN